MRTQFLALVVSGAAAASLYACADTPDEIINPGSWDQEKQNAKQFYLDKVHPMFEATCTFCHAAEATEGLPEAPRWLSFDANKAYAAIESNGSLMAHPDNSLILLQGEHMGPALQPNQQAVVREWLMMEAEARDLPGSSGNPNGSNVSSATGQQPPPGITAAEALDQFASCMEIEDFVLDEGSGMDLLPYNHTSGWGPCLGCHNLGWAGAYLADNIQATFDHIVMKPYLLKLVKAEVANGAFQDIVQSDRFRLKGTEICNYADPNLCHPKFTLNPLVDEGIDAFFQATYDRWKAAGGPCDGTPMGVGGGGGMGGYGGAGGAGGGI